MREGRTDLEWESRFTDLYRTPARVRDVTLRLAGFVVPLILVFALLSTVTEGSERRQVVGTYLLAVTVALLSVWATEPFMERFAARQRVGRALASELRTMSRLHSETSEHGVDLLGDKDAEGTYPVLSQRRLLFRLEQDQMLRHGVSVMALWPFAMRFLDDDEQSRVSGLGARRAANLAAAAGGVLAGLAGSGAALGGAATYEGNELPTSSWALFMAGSLFLVGGLARAARSAAELYRLKVEMIWRHATHIIATVEASLSGRSPVDRLRSLTVQVLDGKVVLPTVSDLVVAASEVTTTIKRSVEDALAPTAPINVMGVLRSTESVDGVIVVELTTGPDVWSSTQGSEHVASSFRVRGGRAESEMPYELVVGPGVVARNRAALSGVIPVEGGTVSVELVPDRGAYEERNYQADEGLLPWVSLYSVGRFVHAVETSPARAAPSNE